MGPIHNFAAYAKSASAPRRLDARRDPRLAPTESDRQADIEFDQHPDLRSLMRELDEWYSD
jgi:hypothetical protein